MDRLDLGGDDHGASPRILSHPQPLPARSPPVAEPSGLRSAAQRRADPACPWDALRLLRRQEHHHLLLFPLNARSYGEHKALVKLAQGGGPPGPRTHDQPGAGEAQTPESVMILTTDSDYYRYLKSASPDGAKLLK
jgi:hypothetical protein